MDDIEAHARPFNNEFGWHMSGSQENAVSSPGDFVITAKAYAGGNNNGDYTCTHLGVTCYVATQSYYLVGSSSLFEYTSSDGNHSAESCFVTAGC